MRCLNGAYSNQVGTEACWRPGGCAGRELRMTSHGSMDGCLDESGECGQTESHSVPYVREQIPPAVRKLPIRSTSKYE